MQRSSLRRTALPLMGDTAAVRAVQLVLPPLRWRGEVVVVVVLRPPVRAAARELPVRWCGGVPPQRLARARPVRLLRKDYHRSYSMLQRLRTKHTTQAWPRVQCTLVSAQQPCRSLQWRVRMRMCACVYTRCRRISNGSEQNTQVQ